MSDEALQRIVTHEAVCAERYGNIVQRIGRIETVLMTLAGGVLIQLLAVAGWALSRVIG